MLKKHDLGITPYIENISSRDQSLVKMGTSRVTLSDSQNFGAYTYQLSKTFLFHLLINHVARAHVARNVS